MQDFSHQQYTSIPSSSSSILEAQVDCLIYWLAWGPKVPNIFWELEDQGLFSGVLGSYWDLHEDSAAHIEITGSVLAIHVTLENIGVSPFLNSSTGAASTPQKGHIWPNYNISPTWIFLK